MYVENVSQTDINSFSGKLIISIGEEKLSLLCSFDESITAGNKIYLTDYAFQAGYNDNTFVDNLIANTDFSKMQFEFVLSEVNN